MKVFISWSGGLSRQVAEVIRPWIKDFNNSLDPFMSSIDIASGRRWEAEVSGQLAGTNFGIICVTKSNQESPWLNFEAGALAKSVADSWVIPLAIDLKPSDIKPPLGQLQAKTIARQGVNELMWDLNSISPQPLGEAAFARAFEVWWPRLELALAPIIESANSGTVEPEPVRDQQSLLEEILNGIRNLQAGPEGSRRAGNTDTPEPSLTDTTRRLTRAVRADKSDGFLVRSDRQVEVIFAEKPSLRTIDQLRHAASLGDINLTIVVSPTRVRDWNNEALFASALDSAEF